MGARQATFEGTQPVRERHQIDEQRLAEWLAVQIPDFRGPLVVRQFKGGQSNPTYTLDQAIRGLADRVDPGDGPAR